MPFEQTLLLIGAVVLANLGVLAAVLLPRFADGRRGGPSEGPADATPAVLAGSPQAVTMGAGDRGSGRPGMEVDTGMTAAAPLDRVVRVVSLLFLAAAGLAVTMSGSFTAVEASLYFLLAVATLGVVVVGDLLPEEGIGRFRHALQVTVAVLVVTILVALTGGVRSPFVAGYFLIVGGAALTEDDAAPTLLSVGSSLAYLITATLVAGWEGLGVSGVAWALFQVVGMALLAYIATVAGRQQRRARQAALRLANFDPLTGLYNRNNLFTAIEREIARTARLGRGFCLLMLDLDDLKPVNDTYGHQVGDRALRAITEVVRRSVRQTDLAARYGGDEFVIILPETDPEGALTVAEKLRSEIDRIVLRVDARTISTSVSIGLVAHPEDGATVEQLIASVDAAMYESKRRGKNQIVGYVTRPEQDRDGDHRTWGAGTG